MGNNTSSFFSSFPAAGPSSSCCLSFSLSSHMLAKHPSSIRPRLGCRVQERKTSSSSCHQSGCAKRRRGKKSTEEGWEGCCQCDCGQLMRLLVQTWGKLWQARATPQTRCRDLTGVATPRLKNQALQHTISITAGQVAWNQVLTGLAGICCRSGFQISGRDCSIK